MPLMGRGGFSVFSRYQEGNPMRPNDNQGISEALTGRPRRSSEQ
jgi:hypothetical protein